VRGSCALLTQFRKANIDRSRIKYLGRTRRDSGCELGAAFAFAPDIFDITPSAFGVFVPPVGESGGHDP
jgi:hypothetical protein